MKKTIMCILIIFGVYTNSFGLFIYKLNYKNIRLVIDRNFPKDGILACSANFTTNFNILKSPQSRLVYSCTSDGVYYNRENPNGTNMFEKYSNSVANVDPILKEVPIYKLIVLFILILLR